MTFPGDLFGLRMLHRVPHEGALYRLRTLAHYGPHEEGICGLSKKTYWGFERGIPRGLTRWILRSSPGSLRLNFQNRRRNGGIYEGCPSGTHVGHPFRAHFVLRRVYQRFVLSEYFRLFAYRSRSGSKLHTRQ